MNSRDLITTARILAEHDPQWPTQANLRRAVSTAYFALFHSLARTAADLFIGAGRSEAWHQVYRALEHGAAKNACRNKKEMQRFPPAIQYFARMFTALQDKRHRADYSLEELFAQTETGAAIDDAEQAINQLEQANDQDRRDFAAYVLFKRRPR